MIAFSGAEGFGASSVGGRGGEVYEVANLNDSGPGSFREAVEASDPRIVNFGVSGTITLTSEIEVANPYLTIAGQTAPGGGICLKGSGEWDGSVLIIRSHNVIVRHIRSRIGAMTGARTVNGIIIGKNSTGDVHDVIVDHCSISWATDENVTLWYDPYNITVQWCIISEGLMDSSHPEGAHSMGIIIGSDGAMNISVHHNLIAHHNGRSPRVRCGGGIVDFVNNVIYNPGLEMGQFDNEYGDLSVNYVGNYIKKGPDSGEGDYEINLSNPAGENTYSIYVRGNIGPNRITDDLDEDLIVVPADRIHVTADRNPAPLVATTSALIAYEQVLMNAGAVLPVRDIVDKRIVNDVINGTGNIIDDPSEVRGWPGLSFSEWHGYIGIENMNLNGGQLNTLLDELKSIGPDLSYLYSQFLPARVCHWVTSGNVTILEAFFNENNLTIAKFKERLGEIFTVDPGEIGHTTTEEDYAGYGTDAVVFDYSGTDYFRYFLFGGTDAEWMESGDECRGYL